MLRDDVILWAAALRPIVKREIDLYNGALACSE